MNTTFDWLAANWPRVALPAAMFVAAIIATLWFRSVAYDALVRRARQTKWRADDLVVEATTLPSILWCVIISAYLALAVSDVPQAWKSPTGRGLWTLLIVSVAISGLNLASRIIPAYGAEWRLPEKALSVAKDLVRVIVLVLAGLVLLELWGAPMSAILLLIAIVAIVAALTLRNTLPSMLAGLQIFAGGHIKVGDYIKLESGEEGYVTEIGWRATKLHVMDETVTIVPNSKLVRTTVTNYGKQMKKATDPFRFYDRMHLQELTGLKARNLQELLSVLKTVPESVTYYHTHNFLEQHQFLSPEPANDFALWVRNILGDEILGERLASIDTYEFTSLRALNDRLVGLIEEHLTLETDHKDGHRNASDGMEFYFVKGVSVIVPTPYLAHDLVEFLETLRKLSLGSLYFHMFESRLRLGKGSNDFSVWLDQSLDEKDLAEQIIRLDPYSYTLEGLRSSLIQLVEKRVR